MDCVGCLRVPPSEPIHPLKEVWLRPRRVFRELAPQPVGMVDYLLAATLGTGNFLALCQPSARAAGAHSHLGAILGGPAVTYGSIAGVVSLFFMGLIYSRLGRRAGGKATIAQVIHVLAYGGVPMAASVGIWLLAALLSGEAAFLDTPPAQMEAFPAFLLHAQLALYGLLFLWSVVLQVMGLSEIQSFTMRKAVGVWLLGQIFGPAALPGLAEFLGLPPASCSRNLVPDR